MHEAALKGRQNKGTRMTINYLYKVGVLSPLTIDNKKPLRLRKRIKKERKKETLEKVPRHSQKNRKNFNSSSAPTSPPWVYNHTIVLRAYRIFLLFCQRLWRFFLSFSSFFNVSSFLLFILSPPCDSFISMLY